MTYVKLAVKSIVDKFLPCKPSDDINFDNFEQSDNFRKLSNIFDGAKIHIKDIVTTKFRKFCGCNRRIWKNYAV